MVSAPAKHPFLFRRSNGVPVTVSTVAEKSMCRIISITTALTLGTTTICYPKRRKNMEQKNLTPEETERILRDFDKKREV